MLFSRGGDAYLVFNGFLSDSSRLQCINGTCFLSFFKVGA